MWKSCLILLMASLILAGCTKDVNLARDVDVLLPTIKPGLDKVMTEKTTPKQVQQKPLPPPTPVATSTATPAPVEPATVIEKKEDVIATLTTSKGVIKLKLYQSKAPNTVKNFLDKAKAGYYTGLMFHRVESWVVQGGDPKGTGAGGGTMTTELNQESFKEGSLGIARGQDMRVSNDSQFFICKEDCNWLTGQYTNFGEVLSGMEVVKQIAIGDKIVSIVE